MENHNDFKKAPLIPWKEASKPDAVERFFIEPFKKLPRQELSPEDAGILLKLFAIEKSGDDARIKQVHDDSIKEPGMHVYRIIDKRSKVMGLTLTPCLMVVIALAAESPAKAVMYLTYIRWWATQNKKESITLQDWCESIMPLGQPSDEDMSKFQPSDEDMSKLWYSIKVKNDLYETESNLLDIFSSYESFFPQKPL